MKKEFTAEEILEVIDKYFSESIFMTDGEGNIVFLNEKGAKRIHTPKEELQGRNIYDLIQEGLYTQSTTKMAIETKKPYTGMLDQGLEDNTASHSVPVLDENGDVYMVITANMSLEHSKEWESILSAERGISERLRREIENIKQQQAQSIVAVSPAGRRIYTNMDIVSPTDSNIIITGESGTGKSMTARYIHEHSQRKDGSFVSVNCAAIPEALLESELFGYEAGAFTGALSKGKIGLFEAADGGTLFLDEISEIPLGLQSKLLSAIEDKKIRKVGGVNSIPVDVRVICATNADLTSLVKEKKFREDLYYRLAVFSVDLPPLRERKEDIIPLANMFLAELNKKNGTNKYLSETAKESMVTHNWPGNVRELRNVIERIYVISYGDALDFVPTPTFGIPAGMYEADRVAETRKYDSLKEYMNEAEKAFIDKVLKECNGSMAETARRLKIDRSALYKKYKKLSE